MSLWPEAFTMEAVGACICSGCSYLLYRSLCRQQSILEAMEAAPDLRCESIVNQTGQVMLAGITGFLRGTVQPVSGKGLQTMSGSISTSTSSSAVSETTRDVTGVVSQTTVTEIMLTKVFGIWSTSERVVNVECQAVPFHIVDGNLNVQVRNPLELASIELQVVGESFEVPTSGFFSSLVSLLQGAHTTGIKHTQEMLVTGTEVVGLGRLVLKSSGFYLERDTTLPYIVSCHTREGVIETYKSWQPYYRVGALLLGSAACYFIFRITLRRIRRAWRTWWRSTSNRARVLALSAASGCEDEDLPSKLSCITCCGLRNAALVPCAHVAVCLKCVDQMRHCPVCRAAIASVQPLIFS